MMSSLYVLKTLYSFECRVFFKWSLLTDNRENDTVAMYMRGGYFGFFCIKPPPLIFYKGRK